MEAVTGIVFVLTGRRFGPSWPIIPYLIFVSSLIVIAFIDIEHFIIPDVISLPGILAGLLISFFPFMIVNIYEALIGVICCAGAFYLISILGKYIWKKDALGMGDIKLIAMIAAFLGWKGGLMTIFWGSLFGSIWGLILILSKRKTRMDIIPFGPFLCLGALLSLQYGLELFWWYQGLFNR